jgi:hypothetical protein
MLFLFALLVQDATIEPKLTWKPVEGHRSDLTHQDTQNQNMVIRSGDKVLHDQKNSRGLRFEATQNILKVAHDRMAKVTWTFRKATRQVEGKDVAFGFEGKTITVTADEHGNRSFTTEDGKELDGEDLEGIRQAFMESNKAPEKDKPTPEELLMPKKPVKVGESWKPDVEAFAKSFLNDADVKGVDLAASKANVTLVSAESKDGSTFGKIEGTVELHMLQFGPLKLDKAIPLILAFTFDGCIDGKRPDGAMKLTMTMKGKGTATLPGADQSASVELDMGATGVVTRTTLR